MIEHLAQEIRRLFILSICHSDVFCDSGQGRNSLRSEWCSPAVTIFDLSAHCKAWIHIQHPDWYNPQAKNLFPSKRSHLNRAPWKSATICLSGRGRHTFSGEHSKKQTVIMHIGNMYLILPISIYADTFGFYKKHAIYRRLLQQKLPMPPQQLMTLIVARIVWSFFRKLRRETVA